ncbi:MAG: hypothetical protein KIT09_30420 [Bryobacteraceae bacterium]|nr:hypothetical protein [Bryobacteraceae bacterium]
MDIDLINAINALAAISDQRMTDALRDGDPVPSNPALQHTRDAVRKRVRDLADRLNRAADAAEVASTNASLGLPEAAQ